jgi:CubicO group peptidase (beta-lactamase class C family)
MVDIVRKTMRKAVEDGVFPSGQLLVVKGGSVVFHEAFGNCELSTVFDVASLTKPVATTTLAIQLVAEDKIRLNDPVSLLIPEFPKTKKPILVSHLLSHSSGLPAWQPYYQMIPKDDIGRPAGKREIIDAVCREPLEYETGYKSVYSDLNFILLGEIIERVTKKSLDKLFAERIAGPLKMDSTLYRPLSVIAKAKPEAISHFAPTEDCPWRKKVLRGEVHDQNCFAMGGVAGHAGLFSTTTDLNKFITAFVESYKGAGAFLSKDAVERFIPFRFKLTECNSTWLLGWDRPAHHDSQAGSHFSARSIGHLGFTGCSMWIDLEKDFWTVLLTNRIHPVSMNVKIRSFRPMLYNLVYEELIG